MLFGFGWLWVVCLCSVVNLYILFLNLLLLLVGLFWIGWFCDLWIDLCWVGGVSFRGFLSVGFPFVVIWCLG